MLRLSPNPGRKSYCSDDWIMKDDRSDGTQEDDYDDDDIDDNVLVIANGHPLPPSSSPDLIRVSHMISHMINYYFILRVYLPKTIIFEFVAAL